MAFLVVAWPLMEPAAGGEPGSVTHFGTVPIVEQPELVAVKAPEAYPGGVATPDFVGGVKWLFVTPFRLAGTAWGIGTDMARAGATGSLDIVEGAANGTLALADKSLAGVLKAGGRVGTGIDNSAKRI